MHLDLQSLIIKTSSRDFALSTLLGRTFAQEFPRARPVLRKRSERRVARRTGDW
jgi:hypothetical protein